MPTDWAVPLAIAAIVLLAVRIVRVRQVRFKRFNDVHAKYAHLVNNLDAMTYNDAQEIMKLSAEFDMPFTVTVSLSFALFKTYAVPTISAVLCKGKELSCPMLAGRRAEDTAVILGEFVGEGLDSERGSTALARMNWLHSRYGKLITRGDKLLTLSQFVFEPGKFVRQFEWRPLSDLEEEARYVYWREVGARMGITDIPATRAALKQWLDDYTAEHVVYHPNNQQVGDATFFVFLRPFPEWMHPMGKLASSILLDDRTREAFGYAKTPWLLGAVTLGLIRLKGLFNGYLSMPRDSKPEYGIVTPVQTEKGTRYVRQGFLFEPWYVNPKASAFGALGYGKPGGEKWYSEGYTQANLGPERLKTQGVEETIAAGKEMREQAKNGACPFFVPPAVDVK